MSAYPQLTTPISIGKHTLRNRMVMGSMHTGLEDRLWHRDKLAAFYAERARGGIGLIITGGFNPNRQGWFYPFSGSMINPLDALSHRKVTRAVHAAGGKICMQLLHAGRYSYHPFSRSASATQSAINPFKAKALSTAGVRKTVKHFARAAKLAKSAGYDGVEIMGSEGYLINQFTAPATNKRSDAYGGSPENRRRFPVEIVEAVRAACGPDFMVIFRLSVVDLVPDGSTRSEILELAKAIEAAGADLLNSGVGWHEARVPTIVTSVPRAAFSEATAAVKQVVDIPVMASNRINTPAVGELIISSGQADMVSMARPLLADAHFANKATENRSDEINICIACNQACLDHTFLLKRATCLVNPQACHETELVYKKSAAPKRVAVIGAGPAGLSCAITAAQCGHKVSLIERSNSIGGQFELASQIPGKEEFIHSIAYFKRQLEIQGVDVQLNTEAKLESLSEQYDKVVIATGVAPRIPSIPGIEHPCVVSYAQLLNGSATAGQRVAVIGAGGIGFDIATYLTEGKPSATEDRSRWLSHWGVDMSSDARGALIEAEAEPVERQVWLLQRKEGKLGKGLGKTTGWVHREHVKRRGVTQYDNCEYTRIDDQGLHIKRGESTEVIEVDTVVICAGQESQRQLYDAGSNKGEREN
ncbi:MAG: FAD-dependent oxidoreductase, partial [Granulosicoccaceae bacterium]